MPGKRVTPETWARHDRMLEDGWSRAEVCRKLGLHQATSLRRDQRLGKTRDLRAHRVRVQASKTLIPGAKVADPAKKALEDFDYFRLRYLGRRPTPWQRLAADQVVQWLNEAREDGVVKNFAVVNVPPGAGKSTTFTHDIVAWLLCRDRTLRVLIGSYTERQAKMYVDRLRRTLEATSPYIPSDKERRLGSVDAEATLSEDFGRFKPLDAGRAWNSREFSIDQSGVDGNIEKEKSVAAYGMDGGFLGGRFDLVIWDDLVDKKNNSNADTRQKVREWYDDIAESRVEPGGLFILQGQRLGPDDLYRHALDKTTYIEDEDEEAAVERSPKYKHVVFRAHDDQRCTQQHKRASPPWDGTDAGGCLLDPLRLPWRELVDKRHNNPQSYLTVYQQEDAHPSSVLVPKLWIDGGQDETGEVFPGCWDMQRSVGVIPKGLTGRLVSIAAADPSPTNWWAVVWMVYHPDTEQHFLIDLKRARMQAPDFLDWNTGASMFTGLMEDWQLRSRELGAPISHWVVEQNAAQRFLLQYDHVRRWQAQRSVRVIGHTTSRNKADPDFGVQSIAPHFRFGRMRLPGYPYDESRPTSFKLIDEVTKWPHGSTEDTVMALWFYMKCLPQVAPQGLAPVVRYVPSWVRRSA